MKKVDLPKIIPVFPLSNFIIFPHTTVPLNIFEPRYLEMINDSMKNSKLIGIIQPKKLETILNQKYMMLVVRVTHHQNKNKATLYQIYIMLVV